MKLGDEERETILQVIMMNNLDMVTIAINVNEDMAAAGYILSASSTFHGKSVATLHKRQKIAFQLSDVTDEASFHRCFSMFLSMFIKKKIM